MNTINLKKVVFVLLALTFVGTTIAQPGRGQRKPPSVEDQLKNLKTELSLTDEQVEQLEPIFTERQKEMQEMFENRSGDRSEMREKMEEMRKKYDEKIAKILSEEQLKAYKELQEKRRPGGPGDGQRRRN